MSNIDDEISSEYAHVLKKAARPFELALVDHSFNCDLSIPSSPECADTLPSSADSGLVPTPSQDHGRILLEQFLSCNDELDEDNSERLSMQHQRSLITQSQFEDARNSSQNRIGMDLCKPLPPTPTSPSRAQTHHFDSDRRLSLVDRLTYTTDIWFINHIAREKVHSILQRMQPGNFIIRNSSQNNTLALSLRLPYDSSKPGVDHYLILKCSQGFHIQGSDKIFLNCIGLVCHYCVDSDGLPCCLTLPPVLMEAVSAHELCTMSVLGADFWTSRLSTFQGKMGDRVDESDRHSVAYSIHQQCNPSAGTLSIQCSPPDSPHHTSEQPLSTPPRPPKSKALQLRISQFNFEYGSRAITRNSSNIGSVSDNDLHAGIKSHPPLSHRDSGTFSDDTSLFSQDSCAARWPRFNPNNPFLDMIQPQVTAPSSVYSVSTEDTVTTASSCNSIFDTRGMTEGRNLYNFAAFIGDRYSNRLRRGRPSYGNYILPGDEGGMENPEMLTNPSSPSPLSSFSGRSREEVRDEMFNDIDHILQRPETASTQHCKRRFLKFTHPPHFLTRRRSKNPSNIIRDYIVTLSDDANSTFGNAVRCFLAKTQEIPNEDPHFLMSSVREFMNKMKSYLNSNKEEDLTNFIEKERAKLRSNECLNMDAIIEAALHRCVIKPLKNHIYLKLLSHFTRNGNMQSLKDSIDFARGKSLEELKIVSGLTTPSESSLAVVNHFLNKLNHSYSPLTKLEQLLSAMHAIYNSVLDDSRGMMSSSSAALGADELLPLVIYTLVNCRMVTAEIEAEFMWHLLPHSLLYGEGGYYLIMLTYAVEWLKSVKHCSEEEDSLSRLPEISSMEGFMKIYIPDSENNVIIGKTLPVKPNMTTSEVCSMISHKFNMNSSQEHALFYVIEGKETRLQDDECPQKTKSELLKDGKVFFFAYKCTSINIIWPSG